MDTILDKSAILERLDGDPELLAELVELFLADCPRLLEEIRGAVASGDASQLMRSAHTLKGSVSNFCAPAAVEAAQRLESMGRDDELAQAPDVLADLDALLERLALALGQVGPGVVVS